MKKIFAFLFNKYLLTAAAFVVWMTFFDQNDLMSQRRTQQQLQDLQKHIAVLQKETAEMEQELDRLQHNSDKLEQYARERYRMKRDNEDLYLIERK